MKVTRAMKRTLREIRDGIHLREAYNRWKSGITSSHEAMLSRMADAGLIDWSHGISDVTLTELGRKAIE